MLFSCTKKETYEAIYDKKGNKIVQLIQKDENNKNAYLAIFSNLEKNHILKISEDIARKYNIEGYNMFFGDSLYYLKQNIENKMLETFSDIHIVPYQYRTTYIYEKDTIMKIIKRNELDGWCGDVVTNKKYNRQDTALLRKALEYLNITDAYIYDFIPSKTYATSDDLICVYSHYNGSSKTFFFWDEANGENKFIINTILIIVLVIVAFLVYFNIGIYTANYSQGTTFSASGVDLNVKSTYITNTDVDGNKIVSDDNTLVVVKFDVKASGVDVLNTGLITLRIGNDSFGQNKSLAKELYDIGTPYNNQKLNSEFDSYIMVFEIPKNLSSRSMKLKMNDNLSYVKGQIGAKNNFVQLRTESFGNGKTVREVNLNENLDFYDSVLGGTSLNISSFEVSDKFRVDYVYCYGTNKCNNSYEYVTPTATGNYGKTLMKLKATLNVDETINMPDLNDFRYFINLYGTINYKVGDAWKSADIASQSVKSTAVNEANTYYIEVPIDVKDASSVYLTFNVRGAIYRYNLK